MPSWLHDYMSPLSQMTGWISWNSWFCVHVVHTHKEKHLLIGTNGNLLRRNFLVAVRDSSRIFSGGIPLHAMHIHTSDIFKYVLKYLLFCVVRNVSEWIVWGWGYLITKQFRLNLSMNYLKNNYSFKLLKLKCIPFMNNPPKKLFPSGRKNCNTNYILNAD